MTGLRPGPGRRRPPTRLRLRRPAVPGPGPRPPSRAASANGAARPPERRAPQRRDPDESVRYGLRVAAGYAWRSVAVAVAVYLVFVALGRLHFVAISVFVGLLITALLRPLTDLLARRIPRGAAVAIAIIQAIVVVGGVVTFVATSAVGQFGRLAAQFATGIREIEVLLSGPPLRLPAGELNRWTSQGLAWLAENRGQVAAQVAGEAGIVVELFAGLALAVFCALFFLHSGERLWGVGAGAAAGAARPVGRRGPGRVDGLRRLHPRCRARGGVERDLRRDRVAPAQGAAGAAAEPARAARRVRAADRRAHRACGSRRWWRWPAADR